MPSLAKSYFAFANGLATSRTQSRNVCTIGPLCVPCEDRSGSNSVLGTALADVQITPKAVAERTWVNVSNVP